MPEHTRSPELIHHTLHSNADVLTQAHVTATTTTSSQLQVMLEEAITAAQAGVVHRFKEIAAERDLADSSDDEDNNTNTNNNNNNTADTQREPALAVLTGTLRGTTSTARRTARASTPSAAAVTPAVSNPGVTAGVSADDGMAELAERARVAGALGVAAAQEGLAAAKRGILTRGLSVLSATLNLHEDADDDAAAVAEYNAQLITAASTTGSTTAATAGATAETGSALVSVRDGHSSAVFSARTDRGSLASSRYGAAADSSEADEYAAAAAAELQAERQYLAQQGQFPLHLYRSGETLQERAFRNFLRIHCLNGSELVTRLRSLDPGMTALKTDELLLELPSKALLLRYAAWWLQHNAHHYYSSSTSSSSGSSSNGEADVSATSNNVIALAGLQCGPHPAALAALATDLRQQFRLTRGAHAVASALAGMLAADSELGVSPRSLQLDRALPDALLRSTALSDLAAGVTAARAEARKTVAGGPTAANGHSGGASPALQEALRVRHKTVAEASAAIAKQQRRLQLAECELREVQKRMMYSDVANHMLGTTAASLTSGSASDSNAAVISAEHRQDWSRRYATAAAAPENTAAEVEVSYCCCGNMTVLSLY
jgi:hypothetical protein